MGRFSAILVSVQGEASSVQMLRSRWLDALEVVKGRRLSVAGALKQLARFSLALRKRSWMSNAAMSLRLGP